MTTYRDFINLLEWHTGLRNVMDMTEKLPHDSTLKKFSAHRDMLAVVEAMIAQMGQAALQKAGHGTEVGADGTGLKMTNASAHFTSRTRRAPQVEQGFLSCAVRPADASWNGAGGGDWE
jgi:hypothetical protein